jgi:hypothetical protein
VVFVELKFTRCSLGAVVVIQSNQVLVRLEIQRKSQGVGPV